MNLRPKHHRGEDEEEETFKAQEDEKDDCCWRREGTALWGKEGQGGGCRGQKKVEAWWRGATVLTPHQQQRCALPAAWLQHFTQKWGQNPAASVVYLFYLLYSINIWMSRNFYKLMRACVSTNPWLNKLQEQDCEKRGRKLYLCIHGLKK